MNYTSYNKILSERPWIHISVHKTYRELDAKLFLAVNLVEKSFNVTLGRSSGIIQAAESLPKGIYCDIRHTILRRKHFERFRTSGSRIFAFDEEASSITDSSAYAEYSVAPDTVSLCEQCFCWGQYHYDLAIGCVHKQLSHKFNVVGHPRFDMLREPGRFLYSNKIETIKACYGDFILITSNASGAVMSGKLESQWDSYVARKLIMDTPNNYARFSEKFSHRVSRHKCLVSLVRSIAKAFPSTNLIVRPHFTETVVQWKEALGKSLKNVFIIHEESSVPWIMAASVVIHSSCTSGTEAFLARTPCITYRALQDERFDAELPNSLSVEATTPVEVVSLLEKWKADPASYEIEYRQPKLELFDSYFAARDGVTSAERVVAAMSDFAFTDPMNADRLQALIKSRGIVGASRSADGIFFYREYFLLKTYVKGIVRHLLERFNGNSPVEPQITRDVIEDRIERFKEYLGWDRKKNIEVLDLGNELFVISLSQDCESPL